MQQNLGFEVKKLIYRHLAGCYLKKQMVTLKELSQVVEHSSNPIISQQPDKSQKCVIKCFYETMSNDLITAVGKSTDEVRKYRITDLFARKFKDLLIDVEMEQEKQAVLESK